MTHAAKPQLVRAIGRWSLAALTINCIIGSGVFGLPSVMARALGSACPLAWILAAVMTGLVMGCFAEVSSRFDQSGGVYLYTRIALGRPAGIAVAWFGLLARLTAIAANANLFVIYLAEFWPRATAFLPRAIILCGLFGMLGLLNYVGVRSGTLTSNLFTAVKLCTLAAFILGGLLYLAAHHPSLAVPASSASAATWFRSILLLIFAYGGYETALTPGAEAKDPRRDYPFALFVALAVCAITYTMTQWIVISIVPIAAMTDRPVASAVRAMINPSAAGLVSLAVLFSCYGYLSANILGFPRILFALAEHGDAPANIARVHGRFRTPHVAIVVLSICSLLFSLAAGFQWNLTISAIARLIYYASVCLALPVLRRRREVPEALFRLPAGTAIAVLALGMSLLLFPKLDRPGAAVIGVVLLCILMNIVWAQRMGGRTPLIADGQNPGD